MDNIRCKGGIILAIRGGHNMNRISTERRVKVLAALVKGNSLRATARMCGVNVNTVMWLLEDVGRVCEEYQSSVFRNLPCKQIQSDEIWSFCYAKAKNVPAEKQGQFGHGDVWTWVALCPDTKLVPCWGVGTRGAATAYAFIHDLAERLASRVQLTTDGHRVYLEAVESAFGSEIDYAMLVKLYGADPREDETRYSPAECIGSRTVIISGRPKMAYVSTSHVERQNLTMRMKMRRFTRLTNAFSKKVENHSAAIALHYMHYNFCRIHQSLRVRPTMEAGITNHVWDMEEIAALLDSSEKAAA